MLLNYFYFLVLFDARCLSIILYVYVYMYVYVFVR